MRSELRIDLQRALTRFPQVHQQSRIGNTELDARSPQDFLGRGPRLVNPAIRQSDDFRHPAANVAALRLKALRLQCCSSSGAK